MEKLQLLNTLAVKYLYGIPTNMWANAHFPSTLQGQLMSNIVELVNKLLQEDRSSLITELLNAI